MSEKDKPKARHRESSSTQVSVQKKDANLGHPTFSLVQPGPPAIERKLKYVRELVGDYNFGDVPDDVLVCQAWEESGFQFDAFNAGGGGFGAIGLFQVRAPAMNDVNRVYHTRFTKEDLWYPAANTAVAASYWQVILSNYTAGDVSKGFNWYRGSGHPVYAQNIVSCASQLGSKGIGALK
jgi:hypothetical protein